MKGVLICLLCVPLAAVADEARPAAWVNGQSIPLAEVDALLQRIRTDVPLTPKQLEVLRKTALDELIDELLLEQFLDQQQVRVDPAEVEHHLHALREVLRAEKKSLADYTRETGLTEPRLRKSLQGLLRWQKYVESHAREEDYRKHFEANQEEFGGATVRAAHILLRLSPAASDGEVAAVREQLVKLREEIVSGQRTFAAAARQYSICSTAAAGGDLGTFGRRDGRVEDELAAAAFSLPVGAISPPVRSAAGMHLIQVNARDPGRPVRYDDVRPQVVESFADMARQRQIRVLRARADLRITLP